jgi:hypothetical protein
MSGDIMSRDIFEERHFVGDIMSRDIFEERHFVGDIMSRDIFAAILCRATDKLTPILLLERISEFNKTISRKLFKS